MLRNKGFTLVELLVYAAIFAIVAGLLTTIFYTVINTQKKTSVSGEVSQQLNLVLTTVQRVVGDASLVEAVYEGNNPSSTCTTFCTLKLRRTASSTDPTIVSSDANGIYLQEGASPQVTLTTDKVLINHFRLTKQEIPGGHAVVEISTSFSYNTQNPTFAVTRAIESAIARVNAATFDADLLPNQDNTFDIGQVSGSNLRWKNGRFSGDVTVGGQITISGGSPVSGKVLTSDASGLGSWQTPSAVPSGAVMSFNLSSCPTGWTEFTQARGRYVVGLPSGGTLASTTGTALSNIENRAAGQHYHGFRDQQNIQGGYTANALHLVFTDVGRVSNDVSPISTATAWVGATENGTVYVPSASLLVAGTNAPYIQLLTCQKD